MPNLDTDPATRFTDPGKPSIDSGLPPTLLRLPDLARSAATRHEFNIQPAFDNAAEATAADARISATLGTVTEDVVTEDVVTGQMPSAAAASPLFQTGDVRDTSDFGNDLRSESRTQMGRSDDEAEEPSNDDDFTAAPSAASSAASSADEGDAVVEPTQTRIASIASVALANKTILGLLAMVMAAAWWSGQSHPRHRGGDPNQSSIASQTNPSATSDPTPPSMDHSYASIDLGIPETFALNPESLQRAMAEPSTIQSDTVTSRMQPQANPPAPGSMFSGTSTTPVQAVASRTANPLQAALANMVADPFHGLGQPSEVADPSSTSQPTTTPEGYRLSRTPHGIPDWSRYLPPTQ